MFLKHFTTQHLIQIIIMASILFCQSLFSSEVNLTKKSCHSTRPHDWHVDKVKVKQSARQKLPKVQYYLNKDVFDSLKYSRPVFQNSKEEFFRVTWSGKKSL